MKHSTEENRANVQLPLNMRALFRPHDAKLQAEFRGAKKAKKKPDPKPEEEARDAVLKKTKKPG